MNCDESFEDFQEIKKPRRHAITRARPIKKKQTMDSTAKQFHKFKKNEANLPLCSIGTKIFSESTNTKRIKSSTSSLPTESPTEFSVSSASNLPQETSCSDSMADESCGKTDSDIYMHSPTNSINSCAKNFLSDASTEMNLSFETRKSDSWLCFVCDNYQPESTKDSHLEVCLRQYEHKPTNANKKNVNSTSSLSPYVCDICKIDISHLDVGKRSEHVNKCLDLQILCEQPPTQEDSTISLPIQNKIFISECPLCLKHFPTAEARSSHIKKCSQVMKIDVQSVIMALQLQEKHALERLSVGLPPRQSLTPKVKTPKSNNKVIKQPKNKIDEDLQLAKALSMSSKYEEEKQKELFAEEAGLNFPDMNSTLVQLLPPQNEQRPGKRKRNAKPVSMLLLRTDEEREKILLQKISSILATENCDSVNENEIQMTVDEDQVNSNKKICHLWNMFGTTNSKEAYYVPELLKYVTYSEVKAGTKLRSLSQVPGYNICTQKLCDFTFNCTPSQQQIVPSTQEMIDVIASGENLGLSTQLQISNIEGNSKDGFFTQPPETVECFPVIECLSTLVGNYWMSDVDIKVANDEIIPAHKLLLNLRCPGLRGELDFSMQCKSSVIDWSCFRHDSVYQFLKFIYVGCDNFSSDCQSDIIQLASRCEIKLPELKTSKKDICSSHVNVLSIDISQSAHVTIESQESVKGEEVNTSKNVSKLETFCDELHSKDISDKQSNLLHSTMLRTDNNTETNDSEIISDRHSESPDSITLVTYCNESCNDKIASNQISLQMDIQQNKMCNNIQAIEKTENSVSNDLSLLNVANSTLSSINANSESPRTPNATYDTFQNSPELFVYDSDDNDCSFIEACNSSISASVSPSCSPSKNCTLAHNTLVSSPSAKLNSSQNNCKNYTAGVFDSNSRDFIRKSQTSPDFKNKSYDILNSSPPKSQKSPTILSASTYCYDELRNTGDSFRSPMKSSDDITSTGLGPYVPDSDIICDYMCIKQSPRAVCLSETCKEMISESKEDMKKEYPVIEVHKISCMEESRASSPIVLSSDEELSDNSVPLTDERAESREMGVAGCSTTPKLSVEKQSLLKVNLCQVWEMSSDEEEKELIPLHMRIKSQRNCEEYSEKLLQQATPSALENSNDFLNYSMPLPDDFSVVDQLTEPAVFNTPKSVTCRKDHQVAGRNDRHSEARLSDSPITPLPNYQTMVTPEIKVALKKFGIRHMPKKKAIALLNHIYEETHPWSETQSTTSNSNDNVVAMSSSNCKDSNTSSVAAIPKHNAKRKPELSSLSQKLVNKKTKSSCTASQKISPASQQDQQNSEKSDDFISSSQDSVGRDGSDILEESILEFETDKFSQGNGSCLNAKQKVSDYILANKELHTKVLTYEPLNLLELHQELKENYIKISTYNLMDFLDEKCVTFTLPRSEKSKKKQQQRCQKFRKRVIAQQSLI